MMKISGITAGLAAGTLVVAGAVTACGNDKSPSPSTSTSTSASSSSSTSSAPSSVPASSSAAAQPGDYRGLLIKPSDIVVPGDTFTLAQTLPVPIPVGVEGVFMSQSGARKVDDTIFVYPDAAAASQALDQNSKMITQLSVNAPLTAADVGTGAQTAVGPSPDGGAKAKGIVMFTEGKVFTVLELESPPNDPVQQDFILDLARKQDAAIKSGLPA
jgi:hypothetical protein